MKTRSPRRAFLAGGEERRRVDTPAWYIKWREKLKGSYYYKIGDSRNEVTFLASQLLVEPVSIFLEQSLFLTPRRRHRRGLAREDKGSIQPARA